MLDIYKASAGAGKTFALTLEYFRTIFASPAEYKNIFWTVMHANIKKKCVA